MATTFEIPQDKWEEFFESFSGRYQSWPVTIEVDSPDLGPQRLAEGIPLQGVSVERAGTAKGAVEINAGDSPDTFMTHVVAHPKLVRVVETVPGADTTLRIESTEEPPVLVHVRPKEPLPEHHG